VHKAADLLARTTEKCTRLVNSISEAYPKNEDVQRLKAKYNPDVFVETLPTSEYIAYSEDKGHKLAFCLNRDEKSNAGNDNLVDPNTLMFVALHELSHIMTKAEGHPRIFWQHFKFLTQYAEKIGVYRPVDYKNNPTNICGMTLTDNPYYDM
jgi:hypothetical protein